MKWRGKLEMMLSCKVSLAMHNAFFLPYLVAFFFLEDGRKSLSKRDLKKNERKCE